MSSNQIEQYIKNLPKDRAEQIQVVRNAINKNLPKGYEEAFQYGMISWVIPLSVFSDTYNKKPLTLASLGNQKNYMALYLNNIYADDKLNKWFLEKYEKSGKKMDIGKSCVRFKSIDDLPVDLVGEAIAKTKPSDLINLHQSR